MIWLLYDMRLKVHKHNVRWTPKTDGADILSGHWTRSILHHFLTTWQTKMSAAISWPLSLSASCKTFLLTSGTADVQDVWSQKQGGKQEQTKVVKRSNWAPKTGRHDLVVDYIQAAFPFSLSDFDIVSWYIHTLSVDIIYETNQLSDSGKGSKLSFTSEDSWGKQTPQKKRRTNWWSLPLILPSWSNME